jgi:hypothetical protein
VECGFLREFAVDRAALPHRRVHRSNLVLEISLDQASNLYGTAI